MSDRSFIVDGLTATAVLHFLPKLIVGVVTGIPRFFVTFITMAFIGYFVLLFSGPPISGPIAPADVRVSAMGTLDNLSVTVWNPTNHFIKRIDMDCGNESVMLTNIEAGKSDAYSVFSGNIMRGPITCEIVELKSK